MRERRSAKPLTYKEIAQTQAQHIHNRSDELAQLTQERDALRAKVERLENEYEGAVEDYESAKMEAHNATKERDALQVRLEDLDETHKHTVENAGIVCDALTQAQKELKESAKHFDSLSDMHNKQREKLVQLEADLSAARTAAELAARHRKASDDLIREYQQRDKTNLDDMLEIQDFVSDYVGLYGMSECFWLKDSYKNAGLVLERRANELLSEAQL